MSSLSRRTRGWRVRWTISWMKSGEFCCGWWIWGWNLNPENDICAYWRRCPCLCVPPPGRSRGRWLKFLDYRRSLLRKSCNKWDDCFHFRSPRESKHVFMCKKTTVSSSWQEAEIDGIHQLVVGATENVKEGNEDIREVICCTPAWPFCSYVSLNTVVSSFITRQSKTTPASGCGSYFSWLCARFLSFSWTGMTASGASRHGLYDKKPGNCRISGTFVLRHRHGNDAETDCPVLHVGSGALYEDTGEVTGSSLMLITHFHCLKEGSV